MCQGKGTERNSKSQTKVLYSHFCAVFQPAGEWHPGSRALQGQEYAEQMEGRVEGSPGPARRCFASMVGRAVFCLQQVGGGISNGGVSLGRWTDRLTALSGCCSGCSAHIFLFPPAQFHLVINYPKCSHAFLMWSNKLLYVCLNHPAYLWQMCTWRYSLKK